MAASESRRARKTVARRWFAICLVCWLALILLSAWISVHTGSFDRPQLRWEAIASPIDALVGAFGTVVLGALLFTRWQDRIEKEKRDNEIAVAEEAAYQARVDWARRNAAYAVRLHHTVSVQLWRAVQAAYAPLSAVLGDSQIPLHLIRADLLRPLPVPAADDGFDSLTSALDELLTVVTEGPLRFAQLQLLDLNRAWTAIRMKELGHTEDFAYMEDLGRAGGTVGADLPKEAFAEILLQFTPAVIADMRDSAQRAQMLAPDLRGIDDVEPHEVRDPILWLLASTWALEELVESPTGTVESRISSVIQQVSNVIYAASSAHTAAWRLAREVVQVTDRGPADLAGYVQDLFRPLNQRRDGSAIPAVLGGPHDREWDLWRDTHLRAG